MAARATTTPIPARTWTRVTDDAGATAVSLQPRRGSGAIYLQGGATTTLPANHPVNAAAGEFEYLGGQGALKVPMGDWFPDLGTGPLHLFVWAEIPTALTVRHA